MSELLALCDALDHAIQPVPGLAHVLQVRAARLKSLAEEIQIAAREVPDGMNCSTVAADLYEAAHGLEASAHALSVAVQQGRSYIQRTVGAVRRPAPSPTGQNITGSADRTGSLRDDRHTETSSASVPTVRAGTDTRGAQQSVPGSAPPRRHAAGEPRQVTMTWYDGERNWNPPSPEPSAWRDCMPAEGDAVQHFGSDWVREHQRVRVPGDLSEKVGSPSVVFDVNMHTLNQVVPGFKHENAFPYVNNMEEVLTHATHWSISGKYVGTETRLEVYLVLPAGQAVIVVLGYDARAARSNIVSAYVLRSQTVENRLKNGRMRGR